MSVLPFPIRAARTSPQPDAKPVSVNVTGIQRELARDLFTRARIRVLSRIVTAATLADDMQAARDAQAELGRLALRGGLLRASKAPSEAV